MACIGYETAEVAKAIYIYHINENQMTKCVLEKRAIQKSFIKITRKHQ